MVIPVSTDPQGGLVSRFLRFESLALALIYRVSVTTLTLPTIRVVYFSFSSTQLDQP